jgi:hypothetical protein
MEVSRFSGIRKGGQETRAGRVNKKLNGDKAGSRDGEGRTKQNGG